MIVTGEETSCGLPIIRTEHPRLFIVQRSDLKMLDEENILSMYSDNRDMFLYMNTKFVYVERFIRSQIRDLYRDVLLHRCRLEREILRNSLAIAAT